MPVNLVPVDVFAANFQAAADGDPVSQATSVNILQEVADALTYLRNRAQYGTMNVALGQPVLQTGGVFNLPAVIIIAVVTTLLVIGVRESAHFNNIIVFIKLAVVVLFIIFSQNNLFSNLHFFKNTG